MGRAQPRTLGQAGVTDLQLAGLLCLQGSLDLGLPHVLCILGLQVSAGDTLRPPAPSDFLVAQASSPPLRVTALPGSRSQNGGAPWLPLEVGLES